MLSLQVFEELRRSRGFASDPTEAVSIGVVEASFKCRASMITLC